MNWHTQASNALTKSRRLLLALTLMLLASNAAAFTTDEEALIAFRNSISNWWRFQRANNLHGWTAQEPVCTWDYIRCNAAGEVVVLWMDCSAGQCEISAEGVLSPHLAGLQHLQKLQLDSNAFSGSIPVQWGLPGTWQNLTDMSVANNNITGTLPAQWSAKGALPSLVNMDFAGNAITGHLPEGWGTASAYSHLQTLDVSSNLLDGPLPASWGGPGILPDLQTLVLYGNRLSGPIPASWVSSSLVTVALLPGNSGVCGAVPNNNILRVCTQAAASCQGALQNLASCTTGAAPAAVPVAAVPPVVNSSGGLSVAAIALTVTVGVVALFIGLCLGLLICMHHRRRRQVHDTEAAAKPADKQGDATALISAAVQPCAYGSKPAESVVQGSLPQLCRLSTSGSGPVAEPLAQAESPGRSGRRVTFALDKSPSLPEAELAPLSAGLEVSQLRRIRSETVSRDGVSMMQQMMQKAAGEKQGSLTELRTALLEQQCWEIRPEEIEIVLNADGSDMVLGKGAYGEVMKGLWKGVLPVAVKWLHEQTPEKQRDFMKEIAVLKSLRCTNIVQFQGACFEAGRTALVTELLEGGDLWHAIEKRAVTWRRRGLRVALDVARALHYLHSSRVVHMDLKSPNILLARDGTAKLTDVGLAKILGDDEQVSGVESQIGTFAWSAPELLWNARCTEKCDIWSYGIVLWEIVTGAKPHRDEIREPQVPEECPAEIAAIVQDCLEPDPAKRPSAKQIVDRLMAYRLALRQAAGEHELCMALTRSLSSPSIALLNSTLSTLGYSEGLSLDSVSHAVQQSVRPQQTPAVADGPGRRASPVLAMPQQMQACPGSALPSDQAQGSEPAPAAQAVGAPTTPPQSDGVQGEEGDPAQSLGRRLRTWNLNRCMTPEQLVEQLDAPTATAAALGSGGGGSSPPDAPTSPMVLDSTRQLSSVRRSLGSAPEVHTSSSCLPNSPGGAGGSEDMSEPLATKHSHAEVESIWRAIDAQLALFQEQDHHTRAKQAQPGLTASRQPRKSALRHSSLGAAHVPNHATGQTGLASAKSNAETRLQHRDSRPSRIANLLAEEHEAKRRMQEGRLGDIEYPAATQVELVRSLSKRTSLRSRLASTEPLELNFNTNL